MHVSIIGLKLQLLLSSTEKKRAMGFIFHSSVALCDFMMMMKVFMLWMFSFSKLFSFFPAIYVCSMNKSINLKIKECIFCVWLLLVVEIALASLLSY